MAISITESMYNLFLITVFFEMLKTQFPICMEVYLFK